MAGTTRVALGDTDLTSAALADGTTNPTILQTGGYGHRFNGTTWDRDRGNINATLMASAARSLGLNSPLVQCTVPEQRAICTPMFSGKPVIASS